MDHKSIITPLELRRLLYELKDQRPDICVRFRQIGEMWQETHLQVVHLTDKGVVLGDEFQNKLVFVPDLKNVMQFEVDQVFQAYQPHFHYIVDPSFSILTPKFNFKI